MTLKNTHVLVTGAGGFIGSHLVERLLEKGTRVRALVHYNARRDVGHLRGLVSPRLEIMMGDIRDHGSVNQAVEGCRTVFHLAALIAIPYSYQAPSSFVDTNIRGTLNVLEACRRFRVRRLIHTSTSEVYGTAQYVPMDEKHPIQTQSPYAASKAAADMLADSFFRSFGVPVVTVRPFNTFGPRQSLRAVIPSILAQAAFGKGPLTLGRVDTVRDFNYVKDTVEAFLLSADCEKAIGQVINIGTGVGRTIAEVTEAAYRLCLRKRPRLSQDPRRLRPGKSEVLQLVCDAERARELLGWGPRVTFDSGLRLTLAYARSHINPAEARDFVL
jgi:NAD dependent epimerase/dehydratase